MQLLPKTLPIGLIMACTLGGWVAGAQELKQQEPVAAVSVTPAEQDERTRQVISLIKEKHYDCLNCHQIEGKLVGPSYREVAAKRKNDKWAEEKLTQVIKSGGSGEYGEGPKMLPHDKLVSDADIKTIVAWILSL